MNHTVQQVLHPCIITFLSNDVLIPRSDPKPVTSLEPCKIYVLRLLCFRTRSAIKFVSLLDAFLTINYNTMKQRHCDD